MTPEEAIQKLDAIPGDCPEEGHYRADEILLALVPPDVRDAYNRVADRAGAWWYA